jgi:hypothetical protein
MVIDSSRGKKWSRTVLRHVKSSQEVIVNQTSGTFATDVLSWTADIPTGT